MNDKPKRLLSIAGSDSGGGAGIQADIKTATMLGAYAMTAITAVTAQDTNGIHAVQLMTPRLVQAQILACLDDIGADAIKLGMLGSAEIALAVAESLQAQAGQIPIVVDPVMIATSGSALLDESGIAVLRERLIPLAALVTPNLPETEKLTGLPCSTDAQIEHAGKTLLAMGAKAALIKGGHGSGEELVDVLVTKDGIGRFPHTRQRTIHTHGTGCTLATAIAVGLAEGKSLFDAASRAVAFVQHAIASAPQFGRGRGPLDHAFRSRPGFLDLDCWGASWTERDD